MKISKYYSGMNYDQRLKLIIKTFSELNLQLSQQRQFTLNIINKTLIYLSLTWQ